MTLVSTNESKDMPKKYEELWEKIRDLIRSITNDSDKYDEKHMKIKFNSDDSLPLKKMLEFHNLIIVIKSVFIEGNKYYTLVFLHEYLYKL